LDEAFVDAMTPSPREAASFARAVRERVLAEVGLTVSAGVASGKMVAKIACDACKPNGLAVVESGSEASYLAPLEVGKLWGVGPKSRVRLNEAGVMTIGDVSAL